jgi:hypothetical protein
VKELARGLQSPPDWPTTLSKRDANFFVKAVKKYGLLSRLEEMCAEISPLFENHPEAARCDVMLVSGLEPCHCSLTLEDS